MLQHSSTTSNTMANGTGLSESADDDLPSVMTCANYLKLPPYSTKVAYLEKEVLAFEFLCYAYYAVFLFLLAI